jgi:hypothetical protein
MNHQGIALWSAATNDYFDDQNIVRILSLIDQFAQAWICKIWSWPMVASDQVGNWHNGRCAGRSGHQWSQTRHVPYTCILSNGYVLECTQIQIIVRMPDTTQHHLGSQHPGSSRLSPPRNMLGRKGWYNRFPPCQLPQTQQARHV